MVKKTPLRGKKGFGFGETIMLLIVLVLFSIFGVVGYKVFTDLNTDIQSDSEISATAKAEVNDLHSRYPSTLDGAFIVIFGLLILLGVVASLVVNSHPIFLFVVIILMVFVGLAAGFLSNTWEEFYADDEFTAFASSFPMTNWVLSNYLIVLAALTVLFGGIVYAKQQY